MVTCTLLRCIVVESKTMNTVAIVARVLGLSASVTVEDDTVPTDFVFIKRYVFHLFICQSNIH